MSCVRYGSRTRTPTRSIGVWVCVSAAMAGGWRGQAGQHAPSARDAIAIAKSPGTTGWWRTGCALGAERRMIGPGRCSAHVARR